MFDLEFHWGKKNPFVPTLMAYIGSNHSFIYTFLDTVFFDHILAANGDLRVDTIRVYSNNTLTVEFFSAASGSMNKTKNHLLSCPLETASAFHAASRIRWCWCSCALNFVEPSSSFLFNIYLSFSGQHWTYQCVRRLSRIELKKLLLYDEDIHNLSKYLKTRVKPASLWSCILLGCWLMTNPWPRPDFMCQHQMLEVDNSF